ncbi:MAG TPA: beta-ketoacyl-[acyl-carrier-protein] synthase family protein [Phycisphaerae bacterium]|nr:beta-ketoacyl-[acyl-carrier-protein] synthase family protein [Phycisphaerae bacterium]
MSPEAIAVTGVGLVLPHGAGVDAADGVFEGRSAVAYLDDFPDVPGATGARAHGFVAPRGTGHLDRAVQFAVAAADEAWTRSGIAAAPPPSDRVAVILSLSKGAVFALWERARQGVAADGSVLDATPDVAARVVAARLGLTGPMGAPVTACASGGHALVWGARLIRRGVVDVAIVGAAEASLCPAIVGSYRRMGVLAAAQGDPATSVRPFSASRRGFAVGEGAGVLVLESTVSAQGRAAPTLALLGGWATGCQTSGLTEMEPDGATLARLIRQALERAGTPAEAVDYVHAHGTATLTNDLAEARAVRAGLGRAAGRVSVSSTKGSHGHLLGATTAVELVLTVLAIQRGMVPPTANLTDPDPRIGLNCTPLRPQRRAIGCALKTASGFGGQMLAVVLAAP